MSSHVKSSQCDSKVNYVNFADFKKQIQVPESQPDPSQIVVVCCIFHNLTLRTNQQDGHYKVNVYTLCKWTYFMYHNTHYPSKVQAPVRATRMF